MNERSILRERRWLADQIALKTKGRSKKDRRIGNAEAPLKVAVSGHP
jgi:hypothetical protein